MNLSRHFTLEEAVFSSTAIRLGIDNQPTPVIVAQMVTQANGMERVRTALGLPLHVDSWFRSKLLNVAIGGAVMSAHMDGLATDFICQAYGPPIAIARTLVNLALKFDELILEHSWIHISFAPALRGRVLTAHFVPGQATTYTDGLPKT